MWNDSPSCPGQSAADGTHARHLVQPCLCVPIPIKPPLHSKTIAPANSGIISPLVARAIGATPEPRHRHKKLEMLFAHLKRIRRMARLRLRGPCGARDEFLLAATAPNLRRLPKRRLQRSLHGGIAL
ncbi:hypothetical protein E0H68_24655 [Rhizobium leguminosarum bv. viciae]|nr:hypothetical protein E0H44_24660 [Rhizobium leguminosarum bv. viciae]TCA10797.1 hypothetical protein E0H68_24655 [Rhizobium leguminosarum bv. viciae]TCA17664.1 hypothetical protein E0H67_29600 [Rhizobium leguminosarum bv. viciae]